MERYRGDKIKEAIVSVGTLEKCRLRLKLDQMGNAE